MTSSTLTAVPDLRENNPIRLLIAARDAGRPPWSWTNLTETEAQHLDQVLDPFVDTYNLTLTTTVEDVIPGCWRLHPGLVQEMPVQFWGWWSAHRDPKSTSLAALEYHNRHLPAFHQRLPKLLGRGASVCRKGNHTDTDPAIAHAAHDAAHAATTITGRQELIDTWRSLTFGS